jgi:hypothetical protein
MKNSGNYIFVSYARVNADRVGTIVEDLRKNGFNVWYDKEICVGTEWPDFIEKKILNCSCFMTFISKDSVDSVNVRNEINLAASRNKEFFVFFLDDTPLKHGLELQIGNKQSFLAYKHTSYTSMFEELASAEILQLCREETNREIMTSDGFQPSSKSLISDALDLFQDTLMKLKGNASSVILADVLTEEEKLKRLINELSPSARSQYLIHLSKIDLFLNALKIQFAYLQPNFLSHQLMLIDTYLSQILPEIDSMRQI